MFQHGDTEGTEFVVNPILDYQFRPHALPLLAASPNSKSTTSGK